MKVSGGAREQSGHLESRRIDIKSPHIMPGEGPEPHPYHQVVAALVAKYSSSEPEVIDIGCGLGQVAELVKAKKPGARIYVADAFQQCIDMTIVRVPVSGSYLVDGTTFDLSHINRDFDVAILSHTLEHLLNPVFGLWNVLGLIRPGGHCVVAVPNPARPSVLIGNIFRKHYVNPGHVVAWDRSHWVNLLERIMKLDVVEYASDTVIICPERIKKRLPSLKRLEMALAVILPWWSFSNIAVIRKTETSRRLPSEPGESNAYGSRRHR